MASLPVYAVTGYLTPLLPTTTISETRAEEQAYQRVACCVKTLAVAIQEMREEQDGSFLDWLA